MRESITKLDLNFTNAGGGHTASITTILGGKALDGSDGLGTVLGEAGELNEFSNPKIATAMGRFLCTQLTTSADAVKRVNTRRYVDRTSLLLESLIVLVRGVGCGPEGGEAERSIPYYSEVINSPLRSFPSMGPKRRGSVIEVGRIYNQEAAAAYSGVKMGLVYNNKELQKDLSLNLDFVSDSYEASPDLAQYQLKFGYTLDDFKEMLSLAGISVTVANKKEKGSGLPSSKKILFEASGTLSSVVSTVASYLGYFWFIDPDSGGIQFVDTQTASALTVTDYTNTENPNIINASFTKSALTNKIVNTYSGTTEKREGDSQSRADMRSRKCFFKNLKLENFDKFKEKITKLELAVFFALFNQEQSTDVFDKYTYVVTVFDKVPPNQLVQEEGDNLFTKYYGDRFKKFDIEKLYPYVPENIAGWTYLKEGKGRKETIYTEREGNCEAVSTMTKLKSYPNRIKHKFIYYRMNFDPIGGAEPEPEPEEKEKKTVQGSKMPRPSGSDLYTFLKAYFSIAGGIFVSNGYAEYKADRMQFTNTNNITVCGPYKGNTILHTIPELSAISDIFDILKLNPVTIKEMAKKTKDRRGKQAQITNDNFFIALKSLPKLTLPVIDRHDIRPEPVDFTDFIEATEIFEPSAQRPYDLFVGGPRKMWTNNAKVFRDIVTQSIINYRAALDWKNTLPLKYMRSKTSVNKKSEEGEEAEDDEIANSSEGDQKESDLFDRFDMRYWGIEQPDYNVFNKLSLAGSSGSTVEMKALRAIRGKYRDASYQPSSSSRTIYGLEIPKFTPTLNGISLSVGPDGITTTLNESTIKLIPPDQSFVQTLGMEALTPKSTLPQGFSAVQRNLLGL